MIKKTLNGIFNFFNNYKVISLGFVLVVMYIWFRFIRERLPKDIPFTLDLLGFIILIEICLLFLYIVIINMKSSHKPSLGLQALIEILFIPLEDFDYFWKHLSFIQPYYRKFAIWFSFILLEYFMYHSLRFYLIFDIFPRLFLTIIFFIDIFYFHELFYIYKFLYLGILLFFHRYIIYSLKMFKNELINEFKEDVDTISVQYEYGIHPSEWPENYDPEDKDNDDVDIFANMSLPVDVYINYYIKKECYKNEIFYFAPDFVVTLDDDNSLFRDLFIKHYNLYKVYDCTPHDSFYAKIKKKYGLDIGARIPYDITGRSTDDLHNQLDFILFLSEFLEYYTITRNENKTFKLLKKMIYINYFICWLYILFISTEYINIIELSVFVSEILFNINEPFSDLPLELFINNNILHEIFYYYFNFLIINFIDVFIYVEEPFSGLFF